MREKLFSARRHQIYLRLVGLSAAELLSPPPNPERAELSVSCTPLLPKTMATIASSPGPIRAFTQLASRNFCSRARLAPQLQTRIPRSSPVSFGARSFTTSRICAWDFPRRWVTWTLTISLDSTRKEIHYRARMD